jgi:lipoprotein-releasing system ATP-binding protein
MTDDITDRPTVLRCRHVGKDYRQGTDLVKVLSDLSCDIGAGERVAIVGASGSGKSTLLNLMGGLDDPTTGEVQVLGQDIHALSESRRASWRNRHLGFVYQFHHLLGEFSARENVAMPLLIAGRTMADAGAVADELLARVGLSHRLEHRPAALSGGERQRVAIARALATSPACVLMDEPTGNLDPATAEKVLQLLLALNRELNISFVVVTHDRDIAGQMDRVLHLDQGALVEESLVAEDIPGA